MRAPLSGVQFPRRSEETPRVRPVRGCVTGKAPFDQPLDIDAADGVVVLTSPNQVELRFTPNAAEETSERLLEAAMKARGQRYFSHDER